MQISRFVDKMELLYFFIGLKTGPIKSHNRLGAEYGLSFKNWRKLRQDNENRTKP